jgi:hypothetical protein
MRGSFLRGRSGAGWTVVGYPRRAGGSPELEEEAAAAFGFLCVHGKGRTSGMERA